MLPNPLSLFKFVFLFIYFYSSNCLFSKYFRKCKLFDTHKGKQLSQLLEEKVIRYPVSFYIQPLLQRTKPIQYIDIDYFYHEYIGSGGSGEVYLVEDMKNNEPKRLQDFQEENFIMHKLNYSVQWTKDNLNGIPKQTDYEKDDEYEHTTIPTIAIYPSKQSLTLRDVEFYPNQASMIFYKILLELQKTHKNSLIHNDIKMGNIMVNSLGHNFKFFQTQLIDWNMASFYYFGSQTNSKKGTDCYYAPEQLMRAAHLTPAIDIWALGVVMWTFFTEDKPFFIDCRDNNLEAIASLVGIKKLIELHEKYRFPFTVQYYDMLHYHINNPTKFPPHIQLRDLIPKNRQNFFTNDLIDIFERMLTPDPQERITINQLLEHRYFKKVKKIPRMYKQKQRQDEEKNRKNK